METSKEQFENFSDQVRIRYEKLERMRERSENPYKNGFKPNHFSDELHNQFDQTSREQLEATPFYCSVAGRIMAIRAFGKAAFVQIKDWKGNIQLFVQKSVLGDEKFAQFKEFDIGDIVYAEGKLFKTKTDELTVNADSIVLLTKSLHPLPEKFHGIADVEIKYRQRYLDLIMNDQTKRNVLIRSKIIERIRKFFVDRDFVEVETPMMHPIAGGATARPFVTHHNTLDMKLYLRIAPELYLKRLVVGGIERVFEINRNFRNEGISIQHNPEFTMLEFYQAYATFEDLMSFSESLFQSVAQDVIGCEKLQYQGTEIDLSGKWKRMRVEEAMLELSGFKDAAKLRDHGALLAYGKSKGYPVEAKLPLGALMMVIFDEEVQPKLIQPTFITHYPLDVSPLSRKNEKDPFLVDRFELFIYGREMANAFSELNDPVDQKLRFEAQVSAKQAGDEEACDMDEDYVRALECGLPPTAGEGVGIDRLVMLFTDSPSIRDVILFPHLRPHALGR